MGTLIGAAKPPMWRWLWLWKWRPTSSLEGQRPTLRGRSNSFVQVFASSWPAAGRALMTKNARNRSLLIDFSSRKNTLDPLSTSLARDSQVSFVVWHGSTGTSRLAILLHVRTRLACITKTSPKMRRETPAFQGSTTGFLSLEPDSFRRWHNVASQLNGVPRPSLHCNQSGFMLLPHSGPMAASATSDALYGQSLKSRALFRAGVAQP